MKLSDFYFSTPSVELDALDFKAPPLFSSNDLKRLGLTAPFNLASFFFKADTGFSLCAYYKQENDHILVASPFGSYRFTIPSSLNLAPSDFEKGVSFDFTYYSDSGALGSSSAKVTNHWTDSYGELADDPWMRAIPLPGSFWTPPYSLHQFRLTGRGRFEYATILLPSPALSIEPHYQGVVIHTEHHSFLIEDPISAKAILEGHIRWGYPQEDGTFLLEPPFVPTS